MKERQDIYLYETDLFKKWLKEKGYKWPSSLVDQENMIAEFQREGLEQSCKD